MAPALLSIVWIDNSAWHTVGTTSTATTIVLSVSQMRKERLGRVGSAVKATQGSRSQNTACSLCCPPSHSLPLDVAPERKCIGSQMTGQTPHSP